jgi:hypothetical protein
MAHPLCHGPVCHGRARPGHPRLALPDAAKSWVAGTRPAMTPGATPAAMTLEQAPAVMKRVHTHG